MQLGYVGINYKNTDLSVRDKITFTDSGIADFMQQAVDGHRAIGTGGMVVKIAGHGK